MKYEICTTCKSDKPVSDDPLCHDCAMGTERLSWVNACKSCGTPTSAVNRICSECRDRGLATPDIVNHPSHYTSTRYECIDVIKDTLTPEEFRGFLKGNVLKYIIRESKKNGVEDLKKAQWYLGKLING